MVLSVLLVSLVAAPKVSIQKGMKAQFAVWQACLYLACFAFAISF